MRAQLIGLICCLSPAVAAAPLDVQVRGDDEPLADVRVMISPLTGQSVSPLAAEVASGEAVIDQVDKEFVPMVSVVRPGTAIRFPNHDDIHHHVYSFSPAKTFELPLYKGVDADPVVFDSEGLVTLGCNIHDWMLAYVVVTDAPVVLTTGAGGHAGADLPAGSYTVEVWHPRLPSDAQRRREVVLDGTGTQAAFSFELEPALLRRRPDALGSDY